MIPPQEEQNAASAPETCEHKNRTTFVEGEYLVTTCIHCGKELAQLDVPSLEEIFYKFNQIARTVKEEMIKKALGEDE